MRVKLGALALHVIHRQLQPEAVTAKAREHVQEEVEDALTGRFTVRDEEVDPFAAHAGAPKRGRATEREAPDSRRGSVIQIAGGDRMPARDDDQVTRDHGLDVHERDGQIVFDEEAGFGFVCRDAAEDAVVQGASPGR